MIKPVPVTFWNRSVERAMCGSTGCYLVYLVERRMSSLRWRMTERAGKLEMLDREHWC